MDSAIGDLYFDRLKFLIIDGPANFKIEKKTILLMKKSFHWKLNYI